MNRKALLVFGAFAFVFLLALSFSYDHIRVPNLKVTQDGFYSAFHDAARLASAKNPESFSGLHIRKIDLNKQLVAMALPQEQTRVHASPVHETILKTGRWAPEETALVEAVLSHFCRTDGPRLFLDIGANVGYYSLIAAAFDCKVMAFDGNMEALAYLRMSTALNGFSDRIQIFQALVSNVTEISFDGWNVHSGAPTKNPAYVTTKAVKLDDVVREPVLYAKIDVEAWEASVFSSAVKLFANKKLRPLYVLFEMTYYLHGEWRYDYLMVTNLLRSNGYTCKSLRLNKAMLLPETKAGFDSLLKEYPSTLCDPKQTHFCQDDYLCQHSSTSFNPFHP